MPKILLAVFTGAAVLTAPAFAQVIPDSATQAAAHGSAQAGAGLPGTSANAGADASATPSASGTQPLGLGGLLKQTQAATPSLSPDPASDGAGPTGSLRDKARAKARARGH